MGVPLASRASGPWPLTTLDPFCVIVAGPAEGFEIVHVSIFVVPSGCGCADLTVIVPLAFTVTVVPDAPLVPLDVQDLPSADTDKPGGGDPSQSGSRLSKDMVPFENFRPH